MQTVAIVFLLIATACKTAPDHHRYTIVVVGSSTAAGYGIKPKDSCWVNRFAQSLGPEVAVRNISKTGYSTYEVMPTLPAYRHTYPGYYAQNQVRRTGWRTRSPYTSVQWPVPVSGLAAEQRGH